MGGIPSKSLSSVGSPLLNGGSATFPLRPAKGGRGTSTQVPFIPRYQVGELLEGSPLCDVYELASEDAEMSTLAAHNVPLLRMLGVLDETVAVANLALAKAHFKYVADANPVTFVPETETFVVGFDYDRTTDNSLAKMLDRGLVSSDEVINMATHIAKGLRFLHRVGIFVGNLGTHNITYDYDRASWIITDYIYAPLVERCFQDRNVIDAANIDIGGRLLAFFPPERCCAVLSPASDCAYKGPVSYQDDVWAFGILILAALKQLPENFDSRNASMIDDTIDKVGDLIPHLDELLQIALVPRREDRVRLSVLLQSSFFTSLDNSTNSAPEVIVSPLSMTKKPVEKTLIPIPSIHVARPEHSSHDIEETHSVDIFSCDEGDVRCVPLVICDACHKEIDCMLYQCRVCKDPPFMLCRPCFVGDRVPHPPTHTFETVVAEVLEREEVTSMLVGKPSRFGSFSVDIFRPTNRNLSITELSKSVLSDVDETTDSFVRSSHQGSSLAVMTPTAGTRRSTLLVPTKRLSEHEEVIWTVTGKLPAGVLDLNKVQQKAKRKQLLTEESANSEFNPIRIIEICADEEHSELLLNNLKLTEIPRELTGMNLPHIRILDLSNNQLTKLPEAIASLSGLESLFLGNNRLTELPETLYFCERLATLDANHNQLTTLPETLMHMDALDTILLDYNHFAEIPPVLEDLTRSLKMFMIVANDELKSFPTVAQISHFKNLAIGIDNHPDVVKQHAEVAAKVPGINVQWNKVFPDKLNDNIFIGSIRSAQSEHVYKTLGIVRVLTVGRGLNPLILPGMKHLSILVDDIEQFEMNHTLEDCADFIHDAVEMNEPCVVHCFAGMSRSATAVIAYLMIKKHMRLDDAYLMVKNVRPAIYPNQGFFNMLLELDAKSFPGERELNMDITGRQHGPPM